MGGSCKERYTKDENNKLERLQQKPDQMEETSWEGQNFYEVVAPQEEEEEEDLINYSDHYHLLICSAPFDNLQRSVQNA